MDISANPSLNLFPAYWMTWKKLICQIEIGCELSWSYYQVLRPLISLVVIAEFLTMQVVTVDGPA